MRNQQQLEEVFANHQQMGFVRKCILDVIPDLEDQLIANCVDPALGMHIMVQMLLHIRCLPEVLIGICRHHCDSLQEVADQLAILVQNGFVQFDGDRLITVLVLTPEEQQAMDTFMYPLPFVELPKFLNKNTDSPYHTRTKGDVVLKGAATDGDLVLSHLNRLNRMKLTVNRDTLLNTQNSWSNLDKQKETETYPEWQKRRKAFQRWDRTIHEVVNEIGDRPIYLSHAYDKRGRTYASGYHINYQGNSYSKAIVEFARKEVVNE